jgi:glycosyltransferase involved in cell wall biosynthesis
MSAVLENNPVKNPARRIERDELRGVLVSFITVNYNYARYLGEAIDSALNQTYGNIEVVVVDDGSTDNSREVIESYGDRIVSVYQPNQGQAAGSNAALKLCRGSIVCFLDADDTAHHDKARNVVNLFELFPFVGWCFNRVRVLNHSTGEVIRFDPDEAHFGEDGPVNVRKQVKSGRMRLSAPPCSGVSARKNVLDRIFPMPTDIPFNNDNYFKYLLMGLSPGYLLNEALTIQKVHGQNKFTMRKDKPERVVYGRTQVAISIRSQWPEFSGLANGLFIAGFSAFIKSGFRGKGCAALLLRYLRLLPGLERVSILPTAAARSALRLFNLKRYLPDKDANRSHRTVLSTRTGSQPLVSILINNYNYGWVLRSAIESALAQSYRNFEVVVVDDGSTDDSAEVIRSFGSKIRSVFQPNQGQASAFNRGFRESRGEIICLLDADDEFYPHKLERVVRVFNDLPEAGWSFHGLNYWDTAAGEMVFEDKSPVSYLCDLREKTRRGLVPHIPVSTSAMSFRREVLDQLLPMPQEIGIAADNYLKFAATGLSKGYFRRDCLAFLRIHHSNSYTMRTDRDQMKAWTRILTAWYLNERWPAFRPIANKMIATGLSYFLARELREEKIDRTLDQYLNAVSKRERWLIQAHAVYLNGRRKIATMLKKTPSRDPLGIAHTGMKA